MLPLLAFSLILCLVSMSGKGWAKNLPPKTRNEFVVASFPSRQSRPLCHVCFVKNENVGCEIKASLRYYSTFYRHRR